MKLNPDFTNVRSRSEDGSGQDVDPLAELPEAHEQESSFVRAVSYPFSC